MSAPSSARRQAPPTLRTRFEPGDYVDDWKEDEPTPSSELKLLKSPEISLEAKRQLFSASLAAENGKSQYQVAALTALPISRQAGGMSQSYLARIVTAGAVTPTAGVAASLFTCDPSSIPLSQWSTLASLFDEVRLHSFSVTIAPYQATPGLSITGPLISSIAMGSFYSKSTLPSNIVQVLTAGDAELVSPLMVKAHKHTMKVPRLGFAPTSSPAGDTWRGCPGNIQLYATGTGSQSMLTYFVCGVYELRGRI